MREIRFRGKSSYDKKWIYGYLYKAKSVFDDKKNCYIRSDNILDFPVENETVGMFTGLKDKNGVEIYEGDILEDTYSDDRATVEWSEEDAMFVLISDNVQTDFSKEASTWWEVVGNIYDK